MNPIGYYHPCVILPRDSHSRSQLPIDTMCLARSQSLPDRLAVLKDKILVHQSDSVESDLGEDIPGLRRHRYFLSPYTSKRKISLLAVPSSESSLRISLTRSE